MTIDNSVAAPQVGEQPAGYGSRLLAAVIDGLLLLVMVLVIQFGWVVLGQPTEPEYPTPIAVLLWAVPALYVIGTGVRCRTIGMLATGLRITGADGAPPSRLRLVGRAVLLFGVVAIIFVLATWWLVPLLLLAYSLLVLANPQRQLPHDQLFRTVVVGRAVPMASQETLDQVRAQYGDLPTPEAKVLLGDLDHLRRRARGALHLASVPMFVIGLIAFGAAVANWDNSFGAFETSMITWALAGPLSLAVTAWWFGRQQQRRSAVTAWRSTLVIAFLVALGSPLTLFLPVGGFLTGAGFLAVAVIQRSVRLGVAAAIFTVVSILESPWLVISNAVTSNSLDPTEFPLLVQHGSSLVYASLALLLVGAAAMTFRQERIGA